METLVCHSLVFYPRSRKPCRRLRETRENHTVSGPALAPDNVRPAHKSSSLISPSPCTVTSLYLTLFRTEVICRSAQGADESEAPRRERYAARVKVETCRRKVEAEEAYARMYGVDSSRLGSCTQTLSHLECHQQTQLNRLTALLDQGVRIAGRD